VAGVDEFDEIEFQAARTGNHARAAVRMTRLAEVAGPGERAESHLRAGEQWMMADDPQRAADEFEAAIEDGGPTFADPKVHLARALLPHLRAQGHGRIIQISSVGGQATMPGTAVYNATKWGVEGFFESLAAEVKGFGIGVTIVEPGSVRTDFTGRSKDVTAALPAYQDTPVAGLRRMVDRGLLRYPGDLAKMAVAILDSATCPVAPLRLTLGSDSYRLIRAGLTARLAELESQQDVAVSTDTRS